MKRLGIFAFFVLFASATLGADGSFGDPSQGQRLFVTKGCVQCHAVRGAGGRIGPDLGRSGVKGSFYELVAAMWNHSSAMEEKMKESRLIRPKFFKQELADLLAFLYFLNYFDEPGDRKSGKALFAEKHCIECHAIGREGGKTGPRLDTFPRGTPPLQIAQNLWNHGPVMVSAMRARDLELPTFKGDEIIDLFAYLRGQGQRQTARVFTSAGDAERGRRLFTQKRCSQCHTVFGKEGIGPDLGRSEIRGSVTQLAGTMWNHWPAMAGAMQAMGLRVPVFEGNQLADVFAYLFISRYDGEPGTRQQGEIVFGVKGCALCHGNRGEGGIGPALASITPHESKELIAQRMWNHAPEMLVRMGSRRIQWPRLSADELSSLIRLLSEGWPERTVATGQR